MDVLKDDKGLPVKNRLEEAAELGAALKEYARRWGLSLKDARREVEGQAR